MSSARLGAASECPGYACLFSGSGTIRVGLLPGYHSLCFWVLSFLKLPLGMSPAFLGLTFLFTWPFFPAGQGGRNRLRFPGINYGKGGLS